MISYEIIFSILCDIILHGGRLGALGGCTGGTHMPRLQLHDIYFTDDLHMIQLREPLVQRSE